MEFHLIDFVYHILNILVLFLLLRLFLYKPVSKYMAAREAKFASERETINAGQQETSALKAQYETSLADARRNADQLVDEKLKAVEQEVEEIRNKARQDAQRILADAHTQTVAERDEMLNELRDQTAALAVELAAHILEREVSAADNQRIIDDFFRKVG